MIRACTPLAWISGQNTKIKDLTPSPLFQLGDFAQYVALYAAGVLAYRHGWLDALTKKQGKQWLWAAVAIAILLPIVGMIGGAFDGDPSEFQGGMQWQSMVGSLWWSMQGLAIILALLIGFCKRFSIKAHWRVRWPAAPIPSTSCTHRLSSGSGFFFSSRAGPLP